MSTKPNPIAMTTALLCGARTTVPETDDAETVADLASRIHRCGMAIRRAQGAYSFDNRRKATQRTGRVPSEEKLDKAKKRADDWRRSLNVSLEDYECDLVISMGGSMLLRYPGMKHPHTIC